MAFDPDADRLLALERAAEERQEAGDFAGVRALLDPLDRELLEREAALAYRLAYALRRLGEPEAALDIALASEEACRRGADAELARRRLNLEGMALFDLGRTEEARAAWADLLGAASQAADHAMVAHSANNLGVVATLADRSDEALAHYSRALAAYERLGDRRGVALTHQNLGIAYRERGLPREADEHFRAAARGARAGVDDDIAGRAAEERAVLILMRGDGALAEATAERARATLAAAGDVAGVAECLRVIGLSRIVAGRSSEARAPLDEALRLAREVGGVLLEAETLESLALLDAEGRDRLRDEAEALFARIGAPGWGRSVRRRMATLLELGA